MDDPPVKYLNAIQPISRFGLALEVFARVIDEGAERPIFACWEFPLSRSRP